MGFYRIVHSNHVLLKVSNAYIDYYHYRTVITISIIQVNKYYENITKTRNG